MLSLKNNFINIYIYIYIYIYHAEPEKNYGASSSKM